MSLLHGAEKNPIAKIHNAFIDIFTTNGIEVAEKCILHVSNEEYFTHHNVYDLALSAFSFNYFKNQSQLLANVHANLKHGGEFFFTVFTQENPEPLNLVAAKKVLSIPSGSLLKYAHEFLIKDQSKALGIIYPKTEELKNVLHHIGFDILLCEEQSCTIVFKNRKEIEEYQRPIIMTRPIAKYIPDMLPQLLFSKIIDELLQLMTKTDNQEFIEEIKTTVVHVRKK